MSKGRYYCQYCDTRPGGYMRPWGLRKHIEKIHGDRYEEMVVRWEDENRINAFIKNAFIKTAYNTQTAAAAAANTQTGAAAPAHTPHVEKPAETDGGCLQAALGQSAADPSSAAEAGPGMAPGGETNLGVERDREAQEAAAEAAPAVTSLKPNPGELDLAVDMLEIMGTQEAMREALNQAIDQLNVHSQSLSEIMGGKPGTAVTVPPVAPIWNLDEVPQWLRDPLVKFMGDIGAAARSLAGGESSENDSYIRSIAVEMEKREKQYREARAKLIVDTIYSDEELYSKPKDSPKPEDVKKLG